jgi:hypothetical protein
VIRLRPEKLGADGISCDEPLASKERQRRVIGHRGLSHQRREQPIGQARDGVLLQQQRRDASERRQGDDGARAVPADANDQVWTPAREQAPRIHRRQRHERET